MTASETRTQADRAYEELRESLVTLRIRPGEPLREADLMARIGVGRTPLREAVHRLTIDQLVVVHARRGTFASEVNLADLVLLTEVRVQLEGLAAARAATRATPAERRRLAELVADPGHDQEPFAAMGHDTAVHRAIWAAAHNLFLERAADRHHGLSTRIWYLFVDRLPVADHVDELGALVESVVAGEAEAADEAAREHVRGFAAAVEGLW